MTLEKSKFKELEELCGKKGFLHAFSYLCRRDCMVGFNIKLSADDLINAYSREKLIKNEISTLHGLMLKSGYDKTILDDSQLGLLIIEAERLLSEIHEELKKSMMSVSSKDNTPPSMEDFFTQPDIIREYIFYGAEQAFDFQFSSLAARRYQEDSQWLLDNMGFSIEDAYSIYCTMASAINKKINELVDNNELKIKSYLDTFEIDVDELSVVSSIPKGRIDCFLKAFSTISSDDNSGFSNIDDFNIVNARPIINVGDKYYLFQLSSLAQSIYESPIFWMRNDKQYTIAAKENRGRFTEEFAYDKLVSVFGKENVFINVEIFKSSSKGIGEIDVLAKFGNKFLIIQAKSKGMTIPSRKGQIELVKDDFAKGFQKAYDQAVICANALMDDDIILKDADGNLIEFDNKPTVCYPICLTSESYPSLAFQCRQYLKYERRQDLNPPFIMDVFFLDILVEFLNNPLLFLSYIDRRSDYLEPIMASTEIVLLSMHLKRNLWIDESKCNFMCVEDDISSDLDAAFMVRRLGIIGDRTPRGILQRYSRGFISKLLSQIERTKEDKLIDFAFILLKTSSNFLDQLDKAISKISYLTFQDNKSHDVSVLFENGSGGLTIHTLGGDIKMRSKRLLSHVSLRKYQEKEDKWTGVIIDPKTGDVLEICHVNFPWKKESGMDDAVKKVKKNNDSGHNNLNVVTKFKIGRNDKCLCGSGKKYKKCCLK